MILDDIVRDKKVALGRLKADRPLVQLEEASSQSSKALNFFEALTAKRPGKNNIIAEVKKASPSKGIIRKDFNPVEIAQAYAANGAAAISVLTEENYFQGSLDYLKNIKKQVAVPVLRKDFLFDPYQVYETKAAGADALLLIAAILDPAQLKELLSLTAELKMNALVEVHSPAELEMVLDTQAVIIGINNRNLKTFNTDIAATLEMKPLISDDKVVVSESGINFSADIEMLSKAGVDAFLIGESLMREPDPGIKLRDFVNNINI
ncbi:MAG: indole-3-glycerol phosphate synthase TrpC [Deltaproteobacteria bacterium]|nr:indole-3-glycerol phosphate synthase TrpC [Deltaproteobacteria bacterium]